MLHQNARETIRLAEERFLPSHRTGASCQSPAHYEFDNAWQELLNHATMKLLEAEQLKHASETEHLRRANAFAEAQVKVRCNCCNAAPQTHLSRTAARGSVHFF